MPKFDHVYCSQCGGEFGPGDHGYSHCENHRKIVERKFDMFIAVRPDGSPCGPCMEKEEDVVKTLDRSWVTVVDPTTLQNTRMWEVYGYRVRKCVVQLLD